MALAGPGRRGRATSGFRREWLLFWNLAQFAVPFAVLRTLLGLLQLDSRPGAYWGVLRTSAGPAINALGAFVPEQQMAVEIAHGDGVARLVEQRGLLADGSSAWRRSCSSRRFGRTSRWICRGPPRSRRPDSPGDDHPGEPQPALDEQEDGQKNHRDHAEQSRDRGGQRPKAAQPKPNTSAVTSRRVDSPAGAAAQPVAVQQIQEDRACIPPPAQTGKCHPGVK